MGNGQTSDQRAMMARNPDAIERVAKALHESMRHSHPFSAYLPWDKLEPEMRAEFNATAEYALLVALVDNVRTGHVIPTIGGIGALSDTKEPETEAVQHPAHYGGENNPHETIKVLRSWLSPEAFRGFCLGNAMKYLSRAGKKGDLVEDLEKAKFYVEYQIGVERER